LRVFVFALTPTIRYLKAFLEELVGHEQGGIAWSVVFCSNAQPCIFSMRKRIQNISWPMC
jgi:hypothetical protein